MSLSADFVMKIGNVKHHLLDAKGNAFYEDYGTIVQGWPYVNIAESNNAKWVRVKFLAPANQKLKHFEWDFGDGVTLKTINREIEHKYDLTTRASWMTQTGLIPIPDFRDSYTGRWTDVTLTAYSDDMRVGSITTAVPGCIYEIFTQEIEINQNNYTSGTLRQNTYDTGDLKQNFC